MCMALQSEKVLHGVVAIAALWYLNVERLSGSDTSSWQIMALGHKHKAIELVREHFSDDGGCGPLDVATALSMMNLASLEVSTLTRPHLQEVHGSF